MFATFMAWKGWKAAKGAMRWFLPLAAVLALIAVFWILIVAPRLALEAERQKAQAEQLQRTEEALQIMVAQAEAQREIDDERIAAVGAAATARRERVERTTVIREAARERAEISGDPEVGDGLDAFFADLRRDQGR